MLNAGAEVEKNTNSVILLMTAAISLQHRMNPARDLPEARKLLEVLRQKTTRVEKFIWPIGRKIGLWIKGEPFPEP